MLTEKLHNRILMPLFSTNKRRAFLIVTRIYFGTFSQKQINHVHTTSLCSQMQRGGSARSFGINFGTFIKQQQNNIGAAVGRRQVQRRPPSIIRQVKIIGVGGQILRHRRKIASGGVFMNLTIGAVRRRNEKTSDASDGQCRCQNGGSNQRVKLDFHVSLGSLLYRQVVHRGNEFTEFRVI